MGRPVGSTNGKPFRDALRLAVAEAEGNPRNLRMVAEALVAEACAGNVNAIKEIADRLDGKPSTVIEGGDKPVGLHAIIERVIVRPAEAVDRDGGSVRPAAEAG